MAGRQFGAQITVMKQMKNSKIVVVAAMLVLALSFLLVGCDRTLSQSQSSTVRSDGTIKTKEKTVTQAPDGTVTKTEENKTTAPAKP